MTDHGSSTPQPVLPPDSPHLTQSSLHAPPTTVTSSQTLSEGPRIPSDLHNQPKTSEKSGPATNTTNSDLFEAPLATHTQPTTNEATSIIPDALPNSTTNNSTALPAISISDESHGLQGDPSPLLISQPQSNTTEQPLATYPALAPSSTPITPISAPSPSPSPTPEHAHSISSASMAATHKRFATVNINKKFLEKSSAATSIPVAPVQHVKPGTPSAPSVAGNLPHSSRGVEEELYSLYSSIYIAAPQPAAHHSRLVTTKLTSLAQATAAHPSTVWTRASSTSSVPPSTAPSANPIPGGLAQPQVGLGKATLKRPVLGSAPPSSDVSSQSAGKAWTSSKLPPTTSRINGGTIEFPTAAEAAGGK